MAPTGFDDFDHDEHIRRAFELAREAVDRGDRPFGSVLVRDDTIVMEDSNHVRTADDIRRHPELELARRAAREYEPETCAKTVMYTSTEPCPMCSGGIALAGLGGVVYSVGADDFAAITDGEPGVRAADVLEDTCEIVGPVLNEEGVAIHEEFGW